MKNTRVLLLGASGYLGAHLYSVLRNDPTVEVCGTSFSTARNSDLVTVDVTNAERITTLLRDFLPDVIIWSLMSKSDEPTLIEKGLDNVLHHISAKTKLIFISSDGVFAQGTGNFSEDDEVQRLQPQNPLCRYTNAKILGESLIKQNHHNHVIVRNGPIYGQNIDGIWDNRVATLIKLINSGQKVTRPGNLYKSFIHVNDLASAISELVLHAYTGTLHLGPMKKENYYVFHRKMAESLQLNSQCVKESPLTTEEAILRGIPLDTSLNTTVAHHLLKTKFRQVINSPTPFK